MLTSYLNKLFNRDADISSLNQRMMETHKISDPAEKALQYGALYDEATRKLQDAKTPSRWARVGFVAGIAIEAVALFAGGWPLMLTGLAVALASSYTERNIGRDAREGLASVRTSCYSLEQDQSLHIHPQDLENSPSRDKALARYPALRAGFLKATNRSPAPAATAPRHAIKAQAPAV